MYYPIKGGSSLVVGDESWGQYRVHLPPVPPKHLILFSDLPKIDQKWTRTGLPDFWEERYLEESDIRDKERDLVENALLDKVTHCDIVLNRFRIQEFIRRMWGVWFMNNGVPTFLDRHHYFYLQWSKYDHEENNGYPFYYNFSRKAFYFRQWCEQNPLSLGYMVIGPRGTGKSSEELACITNNMTLRHNKKAALQSKSFEGDSQKILFNEKLVPLFNNLPPFFKPVNNHGTNPATKLNFFRDPKKGAMAKKVKFGPEYELSTTIRPVGPGEGELDGATEAEILEDEIGKTHPNLQADIYKRHTKNVRSVFRNHRKIGLLRKTSTVEEMDEGGDECLALWDDSDNSPEKLDGNGMTVSKIHRYFFSALDTDTSPEVCDDYGNVDREKAENKIDNERAAIKHDLKKLSSSMRKSPKTVEEAFIKDQSKSIFNVFLLTKRLTELHKMRKPPYVRGNLYWVDDKENGTVGFERDDYAGRFYWAWFPDEFSGKKEPKDWKILNNVGKEQGYNRKGDSVIQPVPMNDHLFAIASDPIKFSKTKDPRASKAAAHGFRKFDTLVDYNKPKEEWLSHNFIFEYIERPDDPETYFDDMGMACFFLGTSILPETNIKSLVQHFESKGWERFLLYRRDFPDIDVGSQDDSGFSSVPEVIDNYTRRLISFINRHVMRMPFERTLQSWLDFDPANTTKYDATVSSGFTLIAQEFKAERDDGNYEQDINDWFDTYRRDGAASILINEDDE
ncbi:hypothetical protein LCGC14_0641770 [marine sediment metagenome]|uniref:Uncharacterized protein n=1 Tax=marine sediment metagenome TaxID=412755 RepID=A0A0F9R435_9ZZZZ|nr:hypothetical protein [Pricia sp.]